MSSHDLPPAALAWLKRMAADDRAKATDTYRAVLAGMSSARQRRAKAQAEGRNPPTPRDHPSTEEAA